MNSPKVIFAGTPEFACVSLRALVNSGIRPIAVYTQPDRPSGRGKKLTASPVKQFALEQGIPVKQPQSLKDASVQSEFESLKPDIFIVAAYGLLLPQAILDVPTHGCLNVHASLLPRWRGAAPIQASLLAGDSESGISLMAMTAGLDCGPVYVAETVSIANDETAASLHDRLAATGGELLVRTLPAVLSGDLNATEQDDSQATYAPKIDKQDAMLDWALPASTLERHVRAYNPVPGAWFNAGGQRIKCWQAASEERGGTPGMVIEANRDGVLVACGEGSLRMISLQRPGKGRVSASEFTATVDMTGWQLE